MEKMILKPQRGNHGGIVIRLSRSWGHDLLTDWNSWKKLLTDWDAWQMRREQVTVDISDVQVIKHNGLGGSGLCPVHKRMHVEILPIDGEFMLCHQALEKVEAKVR